MVAIEERRRGRYRLLGLFAVGFVPMLIAWSLVYGGWHPSQMTVHGELVSPTTHINDKLQFSFDSSHQKWSLLVVNETCLVACQRRLERLRKMHVALGRHADDLQRVLVSDSQNRKLMMDPFLRHWSLTYVKQSAQEELAEAVWLVDPNGWLVLSFPLGLPEAQVYEDVLKLIKAKARG